VPGVLIVVVGTMTVVVRVALSSHRSSHDLLTGMLREAGLDGGTLMPVVVMMVMFHWCSATPDCCNSSGRAACH
jgi:hypothetical protein